MAKCSVVWHGAEEYDVKNEHQDTEPERGGREGRTFVFFWAHAEQGWRLRPARMEGEMSDEERYADGLAL